MAIDREKIDRAIALMKKGPVNADYFFEQLKSPAWIEPLARKKLFSTPYPAVRSRDTIAFPVWTPGHYLARMAVLPEAQGRVLEILKGLPESDNPRVYEVVADAATVLTPELSRQLTPQLLRGVNLPFQLNLPEKVAGIVVALATAGHGAEALTLAEALFAIKPSPRPQGESEDEALSRWIRREARGRFDDWEYGKLLGQCLGVLVRSSGVNALRLLCDLLERAVAEGRIEHEEGPQDHSYIWRPSVKQPESPRENVRDDLVSAVRDAGNQIIESSPELLAEVVEHLRARPTRIFQRIALYLLDVHGARSVPLVQEFLNNPDDWGDVGLHPEYAQLLAHFFNRLSADCQQRFLDWVDKGPDVDSYVAFRRQMDGHDPQDDDVNRHRDLWTRDHLGVIGPHLPPAHEKVLGALVASLGEPRELGPLVRVSAGWRGERSPLTDEEAASLDWPTLTAKLRDWSPPSSDIDGPSEEGLAGSVRLRVSSSPRDAIDHLHDVVDVDPLYLSAILEALRGALKREEALDWRSLVQFLDQVVAQADAAADKLDRWRWVSKCVASLVDDCFEAGAASIPEGLRAEVWHVLERLAENPDPTPEHEARFGGDNMDPATLGLNTVRGETLHGVMRYALWRRRHLESLPDSTDRLRWGLGELPEVRVLLEKHLDRKHDASVAVRSVYGRWFPWIVLLDPDWAATHVRDIFSAEAEDSSLFWAAWGAYVAFCPPYTSVLPILRPVYAQAIGAAQEGMVRKGGMGERPSERLAEHVMAYYWRGELTLAGDDLVAAFFESADPKLRGHALESLGRTLAQQEEPLPLDAQDRLRALWEWRATQESVAREELQAFGWWFGSGQLDRQWSLEVLRTLLAGSVLPEPDHMVAERLAVVAEAYPAAAVQCLDRMVDLASAGWSIHGWLDSARTILEAGLKSTDAEAKERAERVIHRLGALRFRDFRALLKMVSRP